MTYAFLEVHVDDRARLVRLDHIREIVAMCEAQAVDAGDPVCAVLNLRGQIVPLLDLSTNARALTPDRFVLVCHDADEGDFGLVVDDVMDIAMVPEENLNLSPGRPAFARIGDALYPVVQPLVAWADREKRGAARTAVVDDAAERRLLKTRAERYADHDQKTHDDRPEHAVFVRQGRRYAVDLVHLREIRSLDDLCLVPGSPNHVPGIIHSRGRLLSAHDLAAFLAEREAPTTYRWLVIVEDGDRQLGLLADDVEGITPIAVSRKLPTPIAMGPKASCFGGVVEDDVLLVHPAGLFDTPSFSLAST